MRVKKNKEWYHLALSGGFADISPRKVAVLAEQINYERALQAKHQALEKLKERKKPAEIKLVENRSRSTTRPDPAESSGNH